tara:strand:+ start:32949 stop:33215 length:267 start_codon:yes stop_codon:yes gene_type:complete
MGAFIVTYDLNNEVRRPPIVDEVKKSPGWAKLSESCYAISTTETATAVHERFKPMLDADDNFYVVTIRKPIAGWGYKNVNEWLDSHVP